MGLVWKSRVGEINLAKRKKHATSERASNRAILRGNDECRKKSTIKSICNYHFYTYMKTAHENERRVIDNGADDEKENAIAALIQQQQQQQQTWQIKWMHGIYMGLHLILLSRPIVQIRWNFSSFPDLCVSNTPTQRKSNNVKNTQHILYIEYLSVYTHTHKCKRKCVLCGVPFRFVWLCATYKNIENQTEPMPWTTTSTVFTVFALKIYINQ